MFQTFTAVCCFVALGLLILLLGILFIDATDSTSFAGPRSQTVAMMRLLTLFFFVTAMATVLVIKDVIVFCWNSCFKAGRNAEDDPGLGSGDSLATSRRYPL